MPNSAMPAGSGASGGAAGGEVAGNSGRIIHALPCDARSAISTKHFAMFESVETIPWAQVSHAYGKATDAPKWIRAFNSPDDNERMETINYFLWSSVFHQYTLYTATPFVIPFVIEALYSPSVSDRDDGMGRPMKCELMHFLYLCARGGQKAIYGKPFPDAPTVEKAIVAGLHLYERYANDSDARVKTDAIWLIAFCSAPSKPA